MDRPEKNTTRYKPSTKDSYNLMFKGSVNEIVPYSNETCLMDILLTKNIDVRFVGEDYRDKRFTGDELDMIVYSRKHSFSSTELRDRVTKGEIREKIKR